MALTSFLWVIFQKWDGLLIFLCSDFVWRGGEGPSWGGAAGVEWGEMLGSDYIFFLLPFFCAFTFTFTFTSTLFFVTSFSLAHRVENSHGPSI